MWGGGMKNCVGVENVSNVVLGGVYLTISSCSA